MSFQLQFSVFDPGDRFLKGTPQTSPGRGLDDEVSAEGVDNGKRGWVGRRDVN